MIQASKQSFFEKKEAAPARQKLIAPYRVLTGEGRDSGVKVFCFFSSEKKALLAYCPLNRAFTRSRPPWNVT